MLKLKKINIVIKEILSKISNKVKKYQADIILVIGVILISLLSFAIGYIVAKIYDKPPLEFENPIISSIKFKLNFNNQK